MKPRAWAQAQEMNRQGHSAISHDFSFFFSLGVPPVDLCPGLTLGQGQTKLKSQKDSHRQAEYRTKGRTEAPL